MRYFLNNYDFSIVENILNPLREILLYFLSFSRVPNFLNIFIKLPQEDHRFQSVDGLR